MKQRNRFVTKTNEARNRYLQERMEHKNRKVKKKTKHKVSLKTNDKENQP